MSKFNIPLCKIFESTFISLFIIFVVYICFSEVLDYGILNWDSKIYVIENICIQEISWSNLYCIFSEIYHYNWHPLTSLSYAIEYKYFADNPKIYHLNNLVLHSINSVLIYFLAKRIYSFNSVLTGLNIVGAITASVLFAIHPQHVESVVWIAERKGLLCTLFFLCSILCYLQYMTKGYSKKYYILAIISFLLSLLSKPMAVTLPVVLVLIDIYPLGRLDLSLSIKNIFVHLGKLLYEKKYFFICSIVIMIITVYAQVTDGSVVPLEQVNLNIRFHNAIFSFFMYLEKWIIPINLSPFYTHPLFILDGEIIPITLLLLLFISVIALLLYNLMKRRTVGMVVVLMIIATLLPVIGIIQVGSQAAADRYTYLPLIPLFIIAGYIFTHLYSHSKFVSVICGCILILFLIRITVNQVKIWQSDLSLWVYANSELIISNPTKLPKNFNLRKVTLLAKSFYYEQDYENALKYYLLVEQDHVLPSEWDYVRFARSYRALGMDFFALQIYNNLLSRKECCDAQLKSNIDTDITDIKIKIQENNL